MATIAELSIALDLSSRYVAELIATGIIPKQPRGRYDINLASRHYFVHKRLSLCEKHFRPERERAAIAERLRYVGLFDQAEDLERGYVK